MAMVIVNGELQGDSDGGSSGSWGSATALTIQGGAITVTDPGVYAIDTEDAAASDDLDTINGGSEGDVIVLKLANDAHNVVLKDGTGNFDLLGLDITLDTTNQRVKLQKDASGNWVEFSSRP